MNPCYFNCLGADLDYIGRKSKFLQQNRENFQQILDCLLDTATMLSVCESDYAKDADKFREYEHVYKKLEEVVNCFNDYGLTVVVPDNLRQRMAGQSR